MIEMTMQRAVLWICWIFLCGCSNIVNTHTRNAVPMSAGTKFTSGGSSSTSNVYKLHDYLPAVADSIVKNRNLELFSIQMPLDGAIGLGGGYAIGGQFASFVCPSFKSAISQGFMSDVPSIKATYSLGYYGKVYLQKSFNLGRDTYIALFPTCGSGMGVHNIAKYTKLRFNYASVELPVTISKQIVFSSGRQVILSGTGRAAYDWIDTDLEITTIGNMFYIFDYYYNQPRLEALRTALMGHVDLSIDDQTYLIFQLGMEHIKMKSGDSWAPIVYFGSAYYLK